MAPALLTCGEHTCWWREADCTGTRRCSRSTWPSLCLACSDRLGAAISKQRPDITVSTRNGSPHVVCTDAGIHTPNHGSIGDQHWSTDSGIHQHNVARFGDPPADTLPLQNRQHRNRRYHPKDPRRYHAYDPQHRPHFSRLRRRLSRKRNRRLKTAMKCHRPCRPSKLPSRPAGNRRFKHVHWGTF